MTPEFRISRHLLIIALGLILLGIINALIISNEIQTLQYDARVINSLGIIRGSVQRAVKLQLVNYSAESAIHTVDSLIVDSITCRGFLFQPKRSAVITERFSPFRKKWDTLKNHLETYQAAPDSTLMRMIVSESESVWGLANDLVITAQIETESRIRHLELVVIIIGLNIATILFIIWLNKTYIRNRLEILASHDSLTGTFNRYSFNSIIDREFQGSLRYNHPLSVLMLDIDHFKRINDTYGHKKGDEVLARIADTISKAIRRSDSLCRIGGEEFAVIAPMTSIEQASTLGDKLRHSVETIGSNDTPSVTVSIGVASRLPNDDQDMLIRRADDALYSAKRNGRNRVMTFLENPPVDPSIPI